MKQSKLLWLSLHILKTDKSCNIMKNMLNTNLWWSGRNSRRKYLSSLVYSLNPKQNWSESIFRQLPPPPRLSKKNSYSLYCILFALCLLNNNKIHTSTVALFYVDRIKYNIIYAHTTLQLGATNFQLLKTYTIM